MIGSPRGKILSWVATRIVEGTGAWIRRVSRTTASRYGRALSSSMVGLSVPTVRSSFRSLVCASTFWVNAKSAQVVAELFECIIRLIYIYKFWFKPCGFVSCNQKCRDLYHKRSHSVIETGDLEFRGYSRARTSSSVIRWFGGKSVDILALSNSDKRSLPGHDDFSSFSFPPPSAKIAALLSRKSCFPMRFIVRDASFTWPSRLSG